MNGKLSKALIINSFVIKLIAIITMTIDHIGIAISFYSSEPWIDIFRIIGRLSLPLFCLCIAEGVRHTKHFGKYILRLGIVGTVVAVFYLVLYFTNQQSAQSLGMYGNIFVDLILGALAVYLLSRKEWYFKIGALLPVGLAIASFFSTSYEMGTNGIVWWFPFCIRTQYGFYGTILIIAFYLAYVLADTITTSYADKMGVDRDVVLPAGSTQFVANITSAIFLSALSFIFWIVSTKVPCQYIPVQPYAILAGLIILLYNGRKGYSAKWFTWFEYLYYPIHIAIIGAIMFL